MRVIAAATLALTLAACCGSTCQESRAELAAEAAAPQVLENISKQCASEHPADTDGFVACINQEAANVSDPHVRARVTNTAGLVASIHYACRKFNDPKAYSVCVNAGYYDARKADNERQLDHLSQATQGSHGSFWGDVLRGMGASMAQHRTTNCYSTGATAGVTMYCQ